MFDVQPPNRTNQEPDELWMQEALRAAQRSLEAGEVPVGAVVVLHGKIIGRGYNRNLSDSDPTAHAEVLSLSNASRAKPRDPSGTARIPESAGEREA